MEQVVLDTVGVVLGRHGCITERGRAASQTPRACVVASLRGVMPD